MSFGIYIHIPFCLQQCPYCDFATLLNDDTKHQDYVDLLKKEIQNYSFLAPSKKPKTLYIGGGTPSILPPSLILELLREFEKQGFQLDSIEEFSIEINPGTLTKDSLSQYLDFGVNRFSVGAQSFNDEILKLIGRKHSAKDTINTLNLLNQQQINYSFDLLFSLPTQTKENLYFDLSQIKQFSPPHISSYYLTIPPSHRLNLGRPDEDQDMEFFDIVEEELSSMGYEQYEISNYSKSNKHSRHNLNTWHGSHYWGIGMSAHSFLPLTEYGLRCWQPNSISALKKRVDSAPKNCEEFLNSFPSAFGEVLSPSDLLNDKVHTSLRLKSGLNLQNLSANFPEDLIRELESKLKRWELDDLFHKRDQNYVLTKSGRRMLNLVLEKLFISH